MKIKYIILLLLIIVYCQGCLFLGLVESFQLLEQHPANSHKIIYEEINYEEFERLSDRRN